MDVALLARGQKGGKMACEHAVRLNNGKTMPLVGFGTWQIPNTKEGAQSISLACQLGYRHFDCASFYGNQKAVGFGLAHGGIKRSEIFITSKVWRDQMGYQNTMDSFFKTLNELNTEYLDLLLIHWPATEKNAGDKAQELNVKTWQAMCELYNEGYIGAIGVSNFLPHHIKCLMDSEIKPMVNQLEFHVGYTQDEAVNFCQQNEIVVTGWSPFGRGSVLSHPAIAQIAIAHGVSPAQVCLRYSLQHGVVPLPKSATPERMVDNLDIFNFELTDDEMRVLDDLSRESFGFSGEHPDEI